VRQENRKESPVFTLNLHRAEQLTPELLKLSPAVVYLPVEEIAAHPETAALAREAGVPLAASLPRICWDRELPALDGCLETARELGITQVLAGTLGMVRHAADLGFQVRGDFGLGLYNSQTMKELEGMGLISATASFEMKLPQIRDLSKELDVELIAYGRLPLMITENCIIHNHTGKHTCGQVNLLTDRKGEQFQVVKAWGCRNEILNAKTLYLADKSADLSRLGLWGIRLDFTSETPHECVRIFEHYLGRGDYQPDGYTRGLYYRGVE
jgi:putative protease